MDGQLPNPNRFGEVVTVAILLLGVLSLAIGGLVLVVMALAGYGLG